MWCIYYIHVYCYIIIVIVLADIYIIIFLISFLYFINVVVKFSFFIRFFPSFFFFFFSNEYHCTASIYEQGVPDCALPNLPDATLIYWDSDCSNIDQQTNTPEQIQNIRAYYKSNLTAAVKTLTATGSYVAIGGPGVLVKTHTKLDIVDIMNKNLDTKQFIILRAKLLGLARKIILYLICVLLHYFTI